MLNKFLIALFSLVIISSGMVAGQPVTKQDNSTKSDSNAGRPGPRNGVVFGQLHDAVTKQAVEYATVAILKLPDSSLAGGGITDAKGDFRIDNLPFGRFWARITFIGYETYNSKPFQITGNASEVDLGKLYVKENANVLRQAEVSGEKSEVMQSIDRKVYNMEKNIVNTGGTVVEVLQQIPSVTTDLDGKIQLRGSDNVTILIDGKPSSLLGADKNEALRQIPSSAIEQIEVVTNPSAKYDAEGMAGIINIVTKKDKMKGINGNVSAGIGTNDKYNFSLGLNNRTARTNVFANYSFRKESRWGDAAGLQEYFIPGEVPYSYDFQSNGFSKSRFNMVKAGADFYIDNYNTLSISGTYSKRLQDKNDYSDLTFYSDSGSITSVYYNTNYADELNQSAEGLLDYRHTFPNSKKELTASLFYSYNDRAYENEYYTSTFVPSEVPYRTNEVGGPQVNATAQADYIHPVNEKSKFETGIKAQHRMQQTITQAYQFESGSYVDDLRYSDDYNYTDDVLAAYLMYSRKLNKKFEINAGLRGEGTLTEGVSEASDSTFENNYFNLFPSVFVKYNLKENNDMQLSYSRRINRPNMWFLNPFVDYSDTLNLRSGNPYLKPELIHSFDLSYARTGDKLSINVSVFYRHTDDLISRFRNIDTATGVAYMRPINYSSSDNVGTELTLRYQLGKKGSIMWSGSSFYNKINGENIDASLQSEAMNWNSRLAVTYKVATNTTLQVTGFYAGPITYPHAIIEGMNNGIDAGVKQDLMKGKASLSLNVTDVFDTRKFEINNFGEYFDYNGYRKRESRVATLTFAYRFGMQESPMSKSKKNQRNDGGQEQPAMDF